MSDTNTGLAQVVIPESIKRRLGAGEVLSFKDLVDGVASPPETVKVGVAPQPREITKAQQAAVERLPEVFAKVVPTERRTLTMEERRDLLAERQTLKAITDMAAARLQDIALTVLNHNDVHFEEHPEDYRDEDVVKDGQGKPFYNDKGHVVAKHRIPTGEEKAFSIETRKGTINADPARLKAIADDPDDDRMTHEDYLAMTVQTRVWDDAKAAMHIRTNPHLLPVLAEAVTASPPTVSVYERKA